MDYENGVPEDDAKNPRFHNQGSLFMENNYSKMPSLVGSVKSSAGPRLPLEKSPMTNKGPRKVLMKQNSDGKRKTMDLEMDKIEEIAFDTLQ